MKQAVVWGAGRIGRGFVAELLFEGDYFVHFVDRDASLVRALNRQGRYTLYKARETGLEKCVLAGNFRAHSTDENLSSLFLQEDCLVVVAVFKNELESAAEMLAPYVALRAEKMPRSPMDFITNVNMNAPEVAFRRYLEQRFSGPARDYLDAQVGVSGIFMMCIAPDATEEMRREDPLAVYHNGFFEQAVDAEAFRGVPPQAPRLRLSHRLAAEEARKLYTLNMAHCALAYLGTPRGYATSFQAVQDAEIRRVVAGALEEASLGLEKQLGFGGEEMLQWREIIFSLLLNPYMADPLSRLGADSRRKLSGNDRLVIPAQLCLASGARPVNLARIIRAGYAFENPDPGTRQVRRSVSEKGLGTAVQEISALTPDQELFKMIMEETNP